MCNSSRYCIWIQYYMDGETIGRQSPSAQLGVPFAIRRCCSYICKIGHTWSSVNNCWGKFCEQYLVVNTYSVQLSCYGMCKIAAWLHHHFSRKKKNTWIYNEVINPLQNGPLAMNMLSSMTYISVQDAIGWNWAERFHTDWSLKKN